MTFETIARFVDEYGRDLGTSVKYNTRLNVLSVQYRIELDEYGTWKLVQVIALAP